MILFSCGSVPFLSRLGFVSRNKFLQNTGLQGVEGEEKGKNALTTNNHQNAYIFFNEREAPQLALFTIYLQLPMYDFPHLLKGLYLCLDYNRNPIARRILFIKHSDSTSMDDFLELKGQLIPQDQLTDEQRPYYNYTCQPGDFIKTCSVPSPLLNEKDLEREKRMLEI